MVKKTAFVSDNAGPQQMPEGPPVWATEVYETPDRHVLVKMSIEGDAPATAHAMAIACATGILKLAQGPNRDRTVVEQAFTAATLAVGVYQMICNAIIAYAERSPETMPNFVEGFDAGLAAEQKRQHQTAMLLMSGGAGGKIN